MRSASHVALYKSHAYPASSRVLHLGKGHPGAEPPPAVGGRRDGRVARAARARAPLDVPYHCFCDLLPFHCDFPRFYRDTRFTPRFLTFPPDCSPIRSIALQSDLTIVGTYLLFLQLSEISGRRITGRPRERPPLFSGSQFCYSGFQI
jgi:hypothetical protein